MNEFETSSLAKAFAHIYYEEEALRYPLAKQILSRYSSSVHIPIPHYKDVFNRSHQDTFMQKQAPSLILAVNHHVQVYKGSRFCQSFEQEHFYYCTNVLNCIYDCEYCYLTGMYPSGNLVVFVNLEDTFTAVDALLDEHPVYLAISYDTDLLALEPMLGLISKWSEYILARPSLTVEIRTKSALSPTQLHLPVSAQMIYAWTLSPETVCRQFEHHTPSLHARLLAAAATLEGGWPVRLSFDPMLDYPHWENELDAFYTKVFTMLDASRIMDLSIGVFRISSSYLARMRQVRRGCINAYPYTTKDGWSSYDGKKVSQMLQAAMKKLSAYVPIEKIDHLGLWEDK